MNCELTLIAADAVIKRKGGNFYIYSNGEQLGPFKSAEDAQKFKARMR